MSKTPLPHVCRRNPDSEPLETAHDGPRADTSHYSTTEPEKLKKCPECSSVVVREKVTGWEYLREHAEDYYCEWCECHFDTPVVEEPRV